MSTDKKQPKSQEIKNLLRELISTVYQLNRDDFHAFFSFSGHVDGCAIHYYHGGWSEGKEQTRIDCYLEADKLKDMIKSLKEASDKNEEELKLQAEKLEVVKYEEFKKLEAHFSGKQ